jgi:hypothetical protein
MVAEAKNKSGHKVKAKDKSASRPFALLTQAAK